MSVIWASEILQVHFFALHFESCYVLNTENAPCIWENVRHPLRPGYSGRVGDVARMTGDFYSSGETGGGHSREYSCIERLSTMQVAQC